MAEAKHIYDLFRDGPRSGFPKPPAWSDLEDWRREAWIIAARVWEEEAAKWRTQVASASVPPPKTQPN